MRQIARASGMSSCVAIVRGRIATIVACVNMMRRFERVDVVTGLLVVFKQVFSPHFDAVRASGRHLLGLPHQLRPESSADVDRATVHRPPCRCSISVFARSRGLRASAHCSGVAKRHRAFPYRSIRAWHPEVVVAGPRACTTIRSASSARPDDLHTVRALRHAARALPKLLARIRITPGRIVGHSMSRRSQDDPGPSLLVLGGAGTTGSRHHSFSATCRHRTSEAVSCRAQHGAAHEQQVRQPVEIAWHFDFPLLPRRSVHTHPLRCARRCAQTQAAAAVRRPQDSIFSAAAAV